MNLTPKHTVQLPSAKALAVALNDDASICAAGDRDGFIHILSVQSGEILRRLRQQHVEFVYTLAFDPDTGHLFSAGKDKSIREWDTESGTMLRDLAGIFSGGAGARTMNAQHLRPGTRSHTMTILSIALAKGGLLGTGSQDKHVKLWKNGEPIRTYDWHTAPVTCVRFQPDTGVLYSASKDKTIRSWDEKTGSLIHKYNGHLGEICALEFLGRDAFVSVDVNGSVIYWDAEKESPVEFAYTAPGRVVCAHFCRAANALLLGCEDGTIHALDLDGSPRKLDAAWSHNAHSIDVRCIHSSGSTVASCDNAGKVILWDIAR